MRGKHVVLHGKHVGLRGKHVGLRKAIMIAPKALPIVVHKVQSGVWEQGFVCEAGKGIQKG